eukprot:Tbor_TRINITY_DN5401_c6_g2::TRINITY_DN5401_c6_g2_i2::g.24290::m.24290
MVYNIIYIIYILYLLSQSPVQLVELSQGSKKKQEEESMRVCGSITSPEGEYIHRQSNRYNNNNNINNINTPRSISRSNGLTVTNYDGPPRYNTAKCVISVDQMTFGDRNNNNNNSNNNNNMCGDVRGLRLMKRNSYNNNNNNNSENNNDDISELKQ